MDPAIAVPPPNLFANDGSFFDNFRKKMASQSKTADLPSRPNCTKQKTGFRPKSACKPINLKASLKKQLKSDLAGRGTLENRDPAKKESHRSSSSSNSSTSRSRSPERSRRGSPEKRKRSPSDRSPSKRRPITPDESSGKSSPSSENSERAANYQDISSDSARNRKRKSRWGVRPADAPVTPTTAQEGGNLLLGEPQADASSPPPPASEGTKSQWGEHPVQGAARPTPTRERSKSRFDVRPADIPAPPSPISSVTPNPAAGKAVVTVINGVPVVIPTVAETPQEVTIAALGTLLKGNKGAGDKNKYEYDSDEEAEDGTWEHKQRLAEIQDTQKQAEELNTMNEGKHHLGDFLPTEEYARFMQRATAIKAGQTPGPLAVDNTAALSCDNVGYKMLQKAGWKEGQGLGAASTGIVNPIDRGMIKPGNAGLGAAKPDEPLPGDDEFDVYRKRMMLAYRFRPNPMNNPRRAYY